MTCNILVSRPLTCHHTGTMWVGSYFFLLLHNNNNIIVTLLLLAAIKGLYYTPKGEEGM